MQMEYSNLVECPFLNRHFPTKDTRASAARFKVDTDLRWDWSQRCSWVTDKKGKLGPVHGVQGDTHQTHLCNYKNEVSGAFASSCQNSGPYCLTDSKFVSSQTSICSVSLSNTLNLILNRIFLFFPSYHSLLHSLPCKDSSIIEFRECKTFAGWGVSLVSALGLWIIKTTKFMCSLRGMYQLRCVEILI